MQKSNHDQFSLLESIHNSVIQTKIKKLIKVKSNPFTARMTDKTRLVPHSISRMRSGHKNLGEKSV